jgi:hypothetical protein
MSSNNLFCYEILSHDGYDNYGPESDIWDLFIIDDKYMLYHYHWENWFTTEKPEKKYELLSIKYLSEMSDYQYDVLNSHIKQTQNPTLINIFKNKSNKDIKI